MKVANKDSLNLVLVDLDLVVPKLEHRAEWLGRIPQAALGILRQTPASLPTLTVGLDMSLIVGNEPPNLIVMPLMYRAFHMTPVPAPLFRFMIQSAMADLAKELNPAWDAYRPIRRHL